MLHEEWTYGLVKIPYRLDMRSAQSSLLWLAIPGAGGVHSTEQLHQSSVSLLLRVQGEGQLLDALRLPFECHAQLELLLLVLEESVFEFANLAQDLLNDLLVGMSAPRQLSCRRGQTTLAQSWRLLLVRGDQQMGKRAVAGAGKRTGSGSTVGYGTGTRNGARGGARSSRSGQSGRSGSGAAVWTLLVSER